jgi:hypothetical protein
MHILLDAMLKNVVQLKSSTISEEHHQAPLKCWLTSTGLHTVINQKMELIIVTIITSVRTSHQFSISGDNSFEWVQPHLSPSYHALVSFGNTNGIKLFH